MIVKHSHETGLMSRDRLSNSMIVVEEEDDDMRRALSAFLGRLGANVVVARNGSEVVEAVQTSRPKLVLCDVKMPERDGFEVLHEIRALGPADGGTVPVVAMSALVTHADTRLVVAGFNACLPKPFTADQLVETILTVINS